MNLYIMRHGDAEQSNGQDSLRALTVKGVDEAAEAGEWLKSQGASIDLAMVSPFLRAQQTFEHVQQHNQPIEHITYNELIPEGSADEVQALLDGILLDNSLDNVLIVSHMPLVCYLVDKLTQQHGPLFATASIIHIEYDQQTHIGVLRFCYHVPAKI
ncbi:phosphohistidine phosphatase SixA [Neptunicella marina]|uniref:Phosphohistidine phosphatase SixA n=1 Tax=Neptunicella marina TaxID=2125989 RepID=A0A8J6IVZ2_9ALTE|nr:phosphohistidine phosphatase SixA [Neptunicella marina]MBC3766722.1 phosphohistidine phosphatase SixA [Neptunicella marina]